MPRRDGHNRKRHVITCKRCGKQFRASTKLAKFHDSCRKLEYDERRKAGIKLKWKPDAWAAKNKKRVKSKRPDGRERLIVVYPVGGPNAQLNADGKFEYRTIDGQRVYWTPEQVHRPIPTPPPKPPAPAQPAQPVQAAISTFRPSQEQQARAKIVDIDGKPAYLYPVLNDIGQQRIYNNALVWQDSRGNKFTETADTPARQQAPKKGLFGRLLG